MKLFFLPDRLLQILINSPLKARFLVFGFGGVALLAIPTSVFFAVSHEAGQPVFEKQSDAGLAVLAAETENPNFTFNVNVPSFFSEDVSVDGGLIVKGKAVFSQGIDVQGSNIDLGAGTVTASNLIYSITAGDGLTVTGGQNPTITNTGVTSLQGKNGKLSLEAGSGISIDGLKITATGSDQDLFKTIAVSGQDDITAVSSTDTLTFSAGSGVTITTDADTNTVTIAASGGGGGGSGLTSLDGLDGVVTIANTSGSGSTITIDNASTSQKGIAQFNSTNFSVSSGIVNLIQSITTSASPSFVGMTLSALTTNGGLLYTNGSGVLTQLGVGTSGYVLTSNGTGAAPSWIPTSSLGYLQRSGGTIIPINITDSLNLGAIATSSALTHLGGTSGESSFFMAGNVGIGVRNPSAKLEVAGDIIPEADGTRSLGSSSRHFDTIYVNTISGASSSSVGTVNSGTWQGSVITPQYGGTGLSSYTSGDMIYASGTTTLSKLGIGSNGNCLTVSSSLPAWGNCGPWSASGSNAYISGGNVGIGTTSTANLLTINGLTSADSNAVLAVSTGNNSKKALVIQGVSGQGANLQEWQSYDGALLSYVTSSGILKQNDPTVIPSYSNTGGTGNRTSSISVSTSGNGWNCCASEMVDSNTANDSGFSFWEYIPGVSGWTIKFDFGSAKLITEATLYMNGANTTQGTWKWQGSNNDSAWTDIGGQFTLTTNGGSTVITLSTLSANSTAYRYYRMLGVSGGVNGGVSNNGAIHSFNEFTFKIATTTNATIGTFANNYLDIGGTTPGTYGLYIGTGKTGKALAVLNEVGDQDILSASTSGSTKFTIDNSGRLYLADATAPSVTTNKLYSVSGSLYWNGTQITGSGGGLSQWTTSGSNIYYSTGNVGIGTSSPLGLFNVNGGPIGKSLMILNQTGNQAIFTASVSGSTKFLIDNAGNVGIGTTNPNGLLNIEGGPIGKALAILNQTGNQDILAASTSGTTKFRINNSGQIYMADGSAPSTTTNMLYSVSGNLYWNGSQVSTGSSSQWTTSSSDIYYNTGNVAIGTTSTSSRLDLKSSGTNTDLQRWIASDGSRLGRLTETSGGAGWLEVDDASGTAQALLRGDGGSSYLSTGNFGIGSTTPGARLDLVSANTTTNAFNLTANSLTTGYGAYFSSTSTALSTGSLMGLDWSPGSSTTATGDLLSLNVGSNGSLGNIFNVKNGGSSVFSVSQTAVTANLPVNFTSPGDVSVAYDLNFTNPTASYINSSAPFYLRAGVVFNSSDLTLATYNVGSVIVDSQAFVANQSASISGQLVAGTSTAPANIGNFYLTNSSTFGKALAILNQTESADILTASSSGTTRFVIAASGNLGIGTTSTSNPITVGSDNTNGNGAYLSAGGSWTNGSSREFKENISVVDYGDILNKINQLGISEWNYSNEQDSVKHIGPIAEDFYSIFGVGNDRKHISTIDPAGIALAGIKALSQKVDELRMQTLTASISAQIAPTAQSLGLTEENATISGELSVLGRTTVSDLGVTGKIVSGLMSIDGGDGSINVVGDLKLQENGFGKIDLFAGKVTVDNKGNITTTGTVTAKSIKTEKLTLTSSDSSTSAVLSASAGKITIPAGKTTVDVTTTALSNDSLIFVTPENPVATSAKKKDSDTFTIKIESSQSNSLNVSWWIVDATSN